MSFEKLLEFRNNCEGYIKYLGMKILTITDGYAEGEIEITGEHLNPFGSVHGGCIFSLIDTTGGAAAMSRGNITTTSSCNINYLNAAIDTKKIKAIAREVKGGKTLLVYDVEVFSEEGELLAKASCTYFRLQEHNYL